MCDKIGEKKESAFEFRADYILMCHMTPYLRGNNFKIYHFYLFYHYEYVNVKVLTLRKCGMHRKSVNKKRIVSC